MAFTQTDLDALDKAIAAGVTSVSYEGRTVTYDTFEDLLRRRQFVAANMSGAPTPLPSVSYAKIRGDNGR